MSWPNLGIIATLGDATDQLVQAPAIAARDSRSGPLSVGVGGGSVGAGAAGVHAGRPNGAMTPTAPALAPGPGTAASSSTDARGTEPRGSTTRRSRAGAGGTPASLAGQDAKDRNGDDSDGDDDRVDESSASDVTGKPTEDLEDMCRYWLRASVSEPHGKEIYALRFCEGFGPAYDNIFATAGGNMVTVYRHTAGSMDVVQTYEDPDTAERYYCLAWCVKHLTGHALVAAAGDQGVIKIINCTTKKLERSLVGHGAAVNDLQTHPVDPYLLLSAGRDEAIRLWNIETGVLVALFAGDQGHRNDVLCVGFHLAGHCFASAGMDNSVKIWALDDHSVQDAIHSSHTCPQPNEFPTVIRPTPAFSTCSVHRDYVDWVAWAGDLIVSKSTEDEAVMWCPDVRRGKDAVSIIRVFPSTDADIWFLKGCLDPTCQWLATGNKTGKVFVYHLDDDPGPAARMTSFKVPDSKAAVRQIAFSADGQSIVYVCDNSTVWRWDHVAAALPHRIDA